MKDYLAMRPQEPEDKVDFGVRGMKWGVNKSSEEVRAVLSKDRNPTDISAPVFKQDTPTGGGITKSGLEYKSYKMPDGNSYTKMSDGGKTLSMKGSKKTILIAPSGYNPGRLERAASTAVDLSILYDIGKAASGAILSHSDVDYLAVRELEYTDKIDHGIKGMKWGVRRPDKAIKAAIAKRAAKGEPNTPTKKAAEAVAESKTSSEGGSKPAEGGAESSSARYARLQAEGKSGKAKDWSDADLKFFNARTDALNKVAKLNETKPNWVAEAAKNTGKQVVQQQMSAIASAVASKYVNEKVLSKLNTKETIADAVAKGVAEAKQKSAVEAGISKALETSSYAGKHKKPLPGVASYRGKRSK